MKWMEGKRNRNVPKGVFTLWDQFKQTIEVILDTLRKRTSGLTLRERSATLTGTAGDIPFVLNFINFKNFRDPHIDFLSTVHEK